MGCNRGEGVDSLEILVEITIILQSISASLFPSQILLYTGAGNYLLHVVTKNSVD